MRCIAVDPSNEWFATGSNDRVIKVRATTTLFKLSTCSKGLLKCIIPPLLPSPPLPSPPLPSPPLPSPPLPQIWELASGKLKLSLTGHISTIRALAVSPRQPYMFSGGEDKMVKCWDLEMNKVGRAGHNPVLAPRYYFIFIYLYISNSCITVLGSVLLVLSSFIFILFILFPLLCYCCLCLRSFAITMATLVESTPWPSTQPLTSLSLGGGTPQPE